MRAPRIPYNQERKSISSDDKFEAAIIAALILIIGIGTLICLGAVVIALWQAGLTNFIVLIGVLSGLFAIGRAIYLTILKEYN